MHVPADETLTCSWTLFFSQLACYKGRSVVHERRLHISLSSEKREGSMVGHVAHSQLTLLYFGHCTCRGFNWYDDFLIRKNKISFRSHAIVKMIQNKVRQVPHITCKCSWTTAGQRHCDKSHRTRYMCHRGNKKLTTLSVRRTHVHTRLLVLGPATPAYRKRGTWPLPSRRADTFLPRSQSATGYTWRLSSLSLCYFCNFVLV